MHGLPPGHERVVRAAKMVGRRARARSGGRWGVRRGFVGVYPGLDDARLDYVADAFARFMAGERAGGR